MATRITPQQFGEAPGLDAWQADAEAASVTFRTPDFAVGAAFVGEIAAIADELDHHPDVDLRYGSVRVRTTTHSSGGLTDRDIDLAQRITQAARSRGFTLKDAVEED